MSIRDRLRDLLWTIKRSRRAHVLIVAVIIVVLVAVLGYLSFQNDETTEEIVVRNGDENPDRVEEAYRVLDGVVVDASNQNLLPRAVMIDNLAVDSVRPSAGLTEASVVYEALVEGGITRLMPVFATSTKIEEIGSVRSSRPYFVQIAREYNGLYVHAGGSPQALEDLRNADDLTDIDDLNLGHPYLRRDPERSAPHNLTTSSDLLAFAIRDRNVENTGNVDAWKFYTEEGEASSTEKTLAIDFSTTSYKVEWKYDSSVNGFYRWNGGVEVKDRKTDESVLAKNVVVQFAPTSLADASRLNIDLVGEGGALVLMNGEMQNATWKKPSEDARTRFYDEDGEEIVFNPGQIWVEILPLDGRVTFE